MNPIGKGILAIFTDKAYLKNVGYVAIGSAISQILSIIASPILANMYSLEAFGEFGIYSATLAILMVGCCARLELAIPLPKAVNDVVKIVKTAILTCLIVSTIVSVILILVSNFIPHLTGLMILLYSLALPLSGLGIILTILHNKLGNYKISGASKIFQTLFTILFSIGVFYKSSNLGLVYGSIIGQLINSLFLYFNLPQSFRNRIWTFKISESQIVWNRYKNFPRKNLIPSLLNSYTTQIPNHFINLIYNLSSTGLYYFSQRLVSIPLTLVSSSVSEVFYQELIKKKNNKEKIFPFVFQNLLILGSIGVVFIICCYTLVEPLINVLFESRWSESIQIIKILSFSVAIKLTVAPLTMLFIASEKLRIISLWHIFSFLGITLVSYFTYLFQLKFNEFILTMVVMDFVLYGSILALLLKTSISIDQSELLNLNKK